MSCRCVLTKVPGGNPLANIDIELIRTDTMAIVEVIQTNKAGEAQFTTSLPAPCFFRPRIIGRNWNLQVVDPGLGMTLYDRVVSPDGLGTDENPTAAVAALAATGGTIGMRTGVYQDGAIITIPTSKNFVIEGIGHGILEDRSYTPVLAVQIHNPAGTGGFDGPVFHVDTNARLTLRGVEVHQDRNYDAIEAHTSPWIIIEDSYVHSDGTGDAIDSSYFIRIHRSVITAASGVTIDVGSAIVYLEATESRLTSNAYSVNGSFSQVYFEKCIMSKFRCHTTTGASRLRITDCKVAGGTAGAPGIEVGNGAHDDIQIFDNEVDGGTGHAVQIGYTALNLAQRYQVNNNRLKSTAGHGLYIAGYVVGLTACGNVFGGNAAGYCIETANASYPQNAAFGCNTEDGTAAGVYGPTITGMGGFGGDHGLLAGLADDDHTQYLLADGTRALSANWNPGAYDIGNYDFTAKAEAVYIDDANFSLDIVSSDPRITFDGLDYITFNRAGNYWQSYFGDVAALTVWGAGMQHLGGTFYLGVPSTTMGQMLVCGPATGVAGGYLSIYQSAAEGGGYFRFDVYEDIMRIISPSAAYLVYLHNDGTFEITPGPLKVDTINEQAADAGVTIESVAFLDGFVEMTEVAEPASPAANKGRLYAADAAGVTNLYFKDAAGTVTNLLAGTMASVEDWSNVTNAAENRTIDMNATTVDELSDVVGTLISDLRAIGLLQ